MIRHKNDNLHKEEPVFFVNTGSHLTCILIDKTPLQPI